MESTLKPCFQRIIKSSMKGEKMCNSITFKPSEAKPGEKIYVRVPGLDSGLCLVPETMCLVFNFKNSNTKSRFLNNLSRLLVSQLQVKVGIEIVYDSIGESTLELYRDLWLHSTRNTMFDYGVANLNTRKLMSGDDSGSDSDTTEGVTDKLISYSFSNFKLRLGKILNDHGVYAPNHMKFDVTYIITLPSADRIMEAQSSQKVGTYTLSNLRLEYETIRSEALATSVLDTYIGGKSLPFEHSVLETTSTWAKGATDINENLYVTRKSLRAVVMLFRYTDQIDDENFIFPNLDEVRQYEW